MESCIYNGTDLSEAYAVIGVQRPLPTPKPSYQFVPGTARNIIRYVDWEPPELSFTLLAKNLDERGRRRAAHELASTLLVEEPVKVAFGSDEGRYYKAVPNGALEFQEFVRSGRLQVNLLCESAAMYGETKTVVASSGKYEVIVDVNGNYPADTVIMQTGFKNPSSGLWELVIDNMPGITNKYGFIVVLPDKVNEHDIVADSAKRVLTIDGANAIPTISARWITFKPGRHRIYRDSGSIGELTVSWTERWL